MIIKDLINWIKYRTTDEDEIKCIEEGHDFEIVDPVTVIVPEQEYERMVERGESLRKETEDGTTLVYKRGGPLPNGQQTWAPREIVNKKCTRCGEKETFRSP